MVRLHIFSVFWVCSGLFPLQAQNTFRVMTYNVENLFDCRHDSLKNDSEFLPEGTRRWTPARYWRKLEKLSKVIAAAGEERIPDLIGMCEVENDSVLHDFTRRSPLRSLGYRYVMTHSPDVRGIDVALLYQPGCFRLLSSREITVPSLANGFRSTRNLLYVEGLLVTGDTLHVVVCHFPSRLGRSRVSDRHRMLVARTLCTLVDSVCASSPNPAVLVMGDFNSGEKDRKLRKTLRVSSADRFFSSSGNPRILYEPSGAKDRKSPVKASYRYKGIWDNIDHIFVNGVLLDSGNRLFTRNGLRKVFAQPFMYEKDATYGGERPFRTFQGPFYKGGVSDHFPVLLDFLLQEDF